MEFMKVGQLAKQSGLTVRTLHHYDEIGILSPSHRQLTHLMEMMIMYDKYYTPEQLEYLKKRGEELGEESIRQVESGVSSETP